MDELAAAASVFAMEAWTRKSDDGPWALGQGAVEHGGDTCRSATVEQSAADKENDAGIPSRPLLGAANDLVRGHPRASQIVFLELLYNLQYIYTSWENTEEDPTPRTRHHTLQFAHMALHRRHKHSVTDGTAMDESRACDDADDGTAVGEGHTQGSMQGSCDGQGRSRLVLLLPVFSRRFHLVLADSFLRSFLRSPGIRLVIRSTCRTELPRCEQGSMRSRAD